VKRPRLCFVVESGTDVRLVEGLAERCELTIVAREIDGGRVISHDPARPLSKVVFPAGRVSFGGRLFRYLLRHADRHDFVLVQGYGIAALAANLAARVTRQPTLMLVCSPAEAYYRCRRLYPYPGKPYRSAEMWLIRMLARANAALAHGYIALSEHLRQVIREHGSVTPIFTIPVYGVDTCLFYPSGEIKAGMKAQLNLPATGSLILFSSRVAPEKDCETLFAALQILINRGRDVWLLNRSGGHEMFLARAEALGLRSRIIATDASHPHGRLIQDYQAADVCVQASREEGLGFSPLEALSCGVPVVAAAVGGLVETIQAGRTGWTYRPGDAHALAACIEEVLDTPAEAHRRAMAGRALVCAAFERSVVFDRLEAVIRSAPHGLVDRPSLAAHRIDPNEGTRRVTHPGCAPVAHRSAAAVRQGVP
jgi:glycosyltransferase involved in cell wall biosynthesis